MKFADNIMSFLFEKEERAVTQEDLYPEGFEIPYTDDRFISTNEALTITAVWAAVTDISTSIASSPLRIVDADGNEVDHPVLQLFEGSEIQSGFALIETGVLHYLMRGNLFWEIALEGLDLYNLDPDKVKVETLGRVKQFRVDGELVDPLSIIHIPGISYGGLTGMDPTYVFRRVFDLMISTERYAKKFYRTGGQYGVLQVDATSLPTPEEGKAIRSDFISAYDGEVPIVLLPKGYSLNTANSTPNNGDFVGNRIALVHDVARMFNTIASRLDPTTGSTYSNRLTDNFQYVRRTLEPHGRRITSVLNHRFLRGTGLRFEFDFSDLLKGSLHEEAQIYQGLVTSGIYLENEAREELGKDPLTLSELANNLANAVPEGLALS